MLKLPHVRAALGPRCRSLISTRQAHRAGRLRGSACARIADVTHLVPIELERWLFVAEVGYGHAILFLTR